MMTESEPIMHERRRPESFALYDGGRSSTALVAEDLNSRLEKLAIHVPRQYFDDLHQYFNGQLASGIDYDTYGPAFASRYFLRNYCKTAMMLKRDAARCHHRILDLGCGSAATSIAYLAYLSDSLGPGRWPVRLVLVDRSYSQLSLARDFIGIAQNRLCNLEVDVEYVNLDLRDLKREGNASDCVFLGHVLTENRESVGEVLQTATGAAGGDADVYMLERTSDSIWAEIRNEVSTLALSSRVELTEAEPRFTTKYLKLTIPRRKQLFWAIRRYFDAWRHQSVQYLDTVFTPHATYHEKPFSEVLCGIEQIRRYWHESVMTQRDLALEVKDVSYSDCEVFAEWCAGFMDREGMRKRVAGVLIVRVDDESGKISSLREYFRSESL